MATVHETMPAVEALTAPYDQVMVGPRGGPGVCVTCFNLIDGYERCYACAYGKSVLDAIAPISYSVAHEPLHHALFSYKRLRGRLADRFGAQLAAILWRYLERHEQCLARAAGVAELELVTTVPSGDRHRDRQHPLRTLVAERLDPTHGRYERLLVRSAFEVGPRVFDSLKYLAVRPLDGESVLLIDDTWTTGANAQSAAAALKAAGAGKVAAVVIGRHVNREWHDNDRRLGRLGDRFDWARCPLCEPDS